MVFQIVRLIVFTPAMKHARSLALVLAALAAPLFPQKSRAEVVASFDYFQEALSPFGEWIEVGDYGLCWRPTGVEEDWAPYTDGYWAYTDAGWTWVSYEDWGGITYHYGRWIHLGDDGWVWVPEYEWGPAWVSWRSNDDYVGWAPLPPEARWEADTGFSTWVDTSYDIGPDSYRFCHTRDFGAPVLAPVCVPWRENVVIIQNTVNITNITYNRHGSVVFCGGPNFVNINRRVHRPIPSLKLLREDREMRGNHGQHQPQVVRGNQLAVYAPKVQRPADGRALPITPRRVVGAEKINRGWSQVPDVAARNQIRQRLQKQTAGLNPRTAPARPVRPADLSSVPQKAQPNALSPSVVARDRNAPQRPARPASGQPSRPVLPRVPADATPPPVAQRARPPQVAVPEESAREAAADRVRPQREQQPVAAQQQEAVQRANEIRNRQAREQNEPRAVAERPQRVPSPPQRPPAEQQAQAEARRQEALQQRQQIVARQQQENANRAAAARQQHEAAQRNNQVRQPQEAAPRANEMRQQQAQQMERRQAAQQANEMRAQQAQHAEVARQRQEAGQQRANEMRQQQAPARQAQAQAPQRPQAAPPSRPAPQPSNDGDDDKRRQRSGR